MLILISEGSFFPFSKIDVPANKIKYAGKYISPVNDPAGACMAADFDPMIDISDEAWEIINQAGLELPAPGNVPSGRCENCDKGMIYTGDGCHDVCPHCA